MSRHSDDLRLRHMLDHAREAVAMSAGRSRGDLERDRSLNLCLVRLVEVAGEAAGRVSQETCCANPAIPWPSIVGMRNRLIHGYDEVDFDILWDVVTQDLPELISCLERLVR